MRYEVIEADGDWIVRGDETELARYDDQDRALSDVAQRLRTADPNASASLAVRYQVRRA